MKIAIIGAGYTGLAAAHELLKNNHSVTIFEKAARPGGLALGFREKNWQWSLEEHYHHWFTNDQDVLSLASEVNFPVLIRRPKTSVLIDTSIYQLDSPAKLLQFPGLSIADKTRMASILAGLKFNPYWKPLESHKAHDTLKKLMGERGYRMIWEPQLANKFGKYYRDISLAWFWARVTKRTSSLAYPEGGFLTFAEHLSARIEKSSGTIKYSTDITKIESQNEKVSIEFSQNGKKTKQQFDSSIVTLPTFAFTKIAANLPESYLRQMKPLKGLGAINLVLRLKKQFFHDGTYWLSICRKDAPVLAVIEHTNFMDKKHYNNEHIVYVGNYLDPNHRYFSLSADQLIHEYDHFLQELHPGYRKNIIKTHIFKAPFAQPIIPVNYSSLIPPHKTPLRNVYLANMQQVYPWDRGTNYAVQLGKKIAKIVDERT